MKKGRFLSICFLFLALSCQVNKKHIDEKVFYMESGEGVIFQNDSIYTTPNHSEWGFWEFVSEKDSVVLLMGRVKSNYRYGRYYHIRQDSLVKEASFYHHATKFKPILGAMGETELKHYNTKADFRLRMLIMPSWNRYEAFRLEYNVGYPYEVWKTGVSTDKAGDLNISYLVHTKNLGNKAVPFQNVSSIPLIHSDPFTKEKVDSIKVLIDSMNFLELNSIEHHDYGTDGTLVMMEYYSQGKYNVIFRHGSSLKYNYYNSYPPDYKRQEIVGLYRIFQSLITQYSTADYFENTLDKEREKVLSEKKDSKVKKGSVKQK